MLCVLRRSCIYTIEQHVPWQSGNCYLLSKIIVASVVPSESGVFAIYASRRPVFIAESANLRKSLLALRADMSRLGFHRPAAFTFELCPAGSRRRRLRELLAEHEKNGDEQTANILFYG